MLPAAHRSAVAAAFFGNFVVGCGVLVVPGMLDLLAADLGVSVPTAGSLLGLAALTMCVGAPLMAALTSRFDRRQLLVASLTLLGLGHLACALAPDFTSLSWLRPVSVLGAAVFTPQVAATLSLMVSAEERATAVTSAFVGWSLASVLGMPVGNLLADGLSWRASFAGVGVLGLLAAFTAWRVFPAGLQVMPLSLRSWGEVLGTARLRWVLLATMAWCAGHFTVVGYITAALREGLVATPAVQAMLMVLMGVTGLAGNIVLSRSVARIGADRGARVSLALVFTGLAMWTVAFSWFASLWAVALAMLVWGLGMFAFNSSQQARLAQSAPALASASIALNSSSLYAGQALGAALGAALVAANGYDTLGPTALAVVGMAICCSLLADRSRSKV